MLLPIRHHPDPCLRSQTHPVEGITDEIRQLISGLRDTMYAKRALGIAAPQVGVSLRIFLIEGRLASETQGDPPALVFINPEILQVGGSSKDMEGCLSFPDIFVKVTRPSALVIRAQNLEGEFFELQALGLFARAIHHEYDHLDGALMIDRISSIQRVSVERKMRRHLV